MVLYKFVDMLTITFYTNYILILKDPEELRKPELNINYQNVSKWLHRKHFRLIKYYI